MCLLSFRTQTSIPLQKARRLHPALRPATDAAASSTAQSVGRAGRVPTTASRTSITSALPCLQSTNASPWRGGPKSCTGSVAAGTAYRPFSGVGVSALATKTVPSAKYCLKNELSVADRDLPFRLTMPWGTNGPGSTLFPSFCWVPSSC